MSTRKAAAAAEVPELPAAGDLASLAAHVHEAVSSPRHARASGFLRALAASPPQVLLVEGGTVAERANTAIYWGMLLNCLSPEALPGTGSAPCFSCPVCLRFLARMDRDLFFLDGSAGGISIDEVRAVRSALGEPPREATRRVVVLAEAQALSEAAANAMLKSLEEVQRTTVFVLTAPQRERLLPTLVSRSWVLTLAWPSPGSGDAVSDVWGDDIAAFLHTGRGLFERTGARGGVDASAASSLLLACQRGLAQALAGNAAASELAAFFASLPEQRLAIACNVLTEGQECLIAQVNPALVVDWIMTRLYLLRPASRRP